MREEARFRDRRSFGSDGNHAGILGVSRRTIIRWKCQLEAEGKIARDGFHVWGPRCRTVRWKFVDGAPPQKESCGSTGTSEPVRRRPYPQNVTQRLRRYNHPPSGRRPLPSVRTYSLRVPRERGEMEIELQRCPDCGGQLDKQPNGDACCLSCYWQESPEQSPAVRSPTAQDVVATVVDTFTAKGIPIPSRHKGMIARQSKELLSDGFDYETVVVAAVVSLKRGQPQNLHFIASDLVLARAGERMTRREYEKALQDEMELR